MRVGVYVSDFDRSIGGGYTFQEDLVRALLQSPARGHTFVVYSDHPARDPAGADPTPPHVRFASLPFGRWRQLRNALSVAAEGATFAANALGYLGVFGRRLRRDGIEFVWYATPRYLRTMLPNLYTVWDLQHRVQPWFPEGTRRGRWHYRDRIYGEALRRAAAVIVPNGVARAEVLLHYQVSGERTLTLPHPTPSFALRAAGTPPTGHARETYGVQGPFVLYPAQLWSHKNHVGLLFALKELRERHGLSPDALFVGSARGNAEYLAFLRRHAEALGLGERVRWPGFVPRDDLVALYREASLLAYPSFLGPENLPPLEAFALGCPVVASDVPGAREQYGDAAVLADPRDAVAFAGAMHAVLTDGELRARLVARGRARATSWTADDYVRGVLEFLDAFALVRRCWP